MTPGTRLVTWLLSTITVVVLLFGYHTSTSGALPAATSALGAPPAGSGASGTSGNGAAGGGGSASGNGSGGNSSRTDSSGSDSSGSGSSGSGTGTTSGTVTGPTVQTQWGPIQVEITVDGGAITDIGVPVYPANNPRDLQINSYALPILVQETLDRQSAQIDMISGATVTSVGYLQSLQAALDKAGL